MDMLENPVMVHAGMEKAAAICIEKGKFHIDSGLTILRLNDSVANMMVISPAHWQEFIQPYFKIVCETLHRYYPAVKIYCHICGNTLPILNNIRQVGIDCIGPLDPLGGFTCAQARQTIGPNVGLMGGVNTISFVKLTPMDILEQSRKCIEQAGQNGAFIVGSGCALPRSSKNENLMALHEAALQWRACK